jgi:type VI secretion system secreted protein Hcp
MPHEIFCTIKGKTQGQISQGAGKPDSMGQSSRGKGYEDKISVYAFSEGLTVARDLTSGTTTGKRQHQPVTFTKLIDKSSPQLWQAASRNETLEKMEFEFYRNDPSGAGKAQMFYKITYENCTICEIRDYTPLTINPANNFFGNMQDVSFTFMKVTWDHNGGKTSGSDDWSGDAH